MTDKHVIELANVRKEYMLGTTKVEALRDVSISVNKGEFLQSRVHPVLVRVPFST
jgi:ABC-type ATPase involved in cell division